MGGIVVLTHKNRPAWQAGKLNGVGGKIELLESPVAAMVREFELGLATLASGETVAGAARFRDGAGRGGSFD